MSRAAWRVALGRAEGRASIRELALAALALAAAAAIVFGPHAAEGGFTSDDWSNAAAYEQASSPRYWHAVGDAHDELGGRPLLALLIPAPHALLGVSPAAQLVLAALLGVLTALAFFALLRRLGLAGLEAGAASLLLLLFPWASAIRLWPTAALNTVAVILFLVGLVVALRGLEVPGRRGAAIHAGAVGLFVASVLTYEVAAAAILISGALFIGRAPLAVAARRWLVVAVSVLAALAYSLASTVSVRHVGSFSERVRDLPTFADHGDRLAARALVPWETVPLPIVAAVLIVGLAALAAAWRSGRRYGPVAAVVGGGLVVAAYVVLLGSSLYPLDPGIDDRANIFAALGYVLVVYGVVAAATALVPVATGQRRALALGLLALVAVGYSVLMHGRERDYARAAEAQERVLASLDRALPALQAHAFVLTYGAPSEAAPGVPVFSRGWDIRGALQLRRSDPTLEALPIYARVTVSCNARSLRIEGPGSYESATVRYGDVYAVDTQADRAMRIDSRASCEAQRDLPVLP